MDLLSTRLLQDWHHVSLQPILLALAFAVLLSSFLPSRTARALKSVPGPYSYPVLGNLGDWHFKGFHNCLLESLLKYGPVFKYKVGRFAVLNVADPEIVQQVSSTSQCCPCLGITISDLDNADIEDSSISLHV
jgi:hypothetical protein